MCCHWCGVSSVWWTLLIVVVGVLIVAVALWQQDTQPDSTGMIGLEGVAQDTFSKEGVVFVRGELWRATAKRGIVQRGERVRITEVLPGLLVVVEHSEADSTSVTNQ